MRTTNRGKQYKCRTRNWLTVYKYIKNTVEANDPEPVLIKIDDILKQTELTKTTIATHFKSIIEFELELADPHEREFELKRTKLGYYFSKFQKVEQKTLSL